MAPIVSGNLLILKNPCTISSMLSSVGYTMYCGESSHNAAVTRRAALIAVA